MKFGGLSLTLGAAGALALMIVGASLSTTAGSNPDADHDGVVDLVDNCLGKANSVNAQGWQSDCDFDGFGDICDGDLDNSGSTDASDFIDFSGAFFSSVGFPNWNHCADMDCDSIKLVLSEAVSGFHEHKLMHDHLWNRQRMLADKPSNVQELFPERSIDQ